MNIDATPTSISTVDGPLEAEWFHSPDERARLVLLPAMGVTIRHYRTLASGLRDGGVTCLTVQYRGQGTGEKIDRRSRFGYSEIATIDIPAAISMAAADTDVPVWVAGHSLGAQIAVLAAGLGALDQASGIITIAGGTPHFRKYPRNDWWRPLLGTTGPAALAQLVGYWPGDRLRIGGRQSKKLMRDWATLAWTGDFTAVQGVDPTALDFHSYDREYAAIVFDDDSLAPRSAAEALAAQLPGARHSLQEVPGSGGHVHWLKQPQNAITAVTEAIAFSQPEQGSSRPC